MYYVNCTEPSCRDNYVEETGRRITERIKSHSDRDQALHMVNIETPHTDVNTANFNIIDMNFGNNKRKWKTAFRQIAKKWTCEKKKRKNKNS